MTQDATGPGPSVVATERLDLRPWRPEEASILLDIRGDPEVARWMSDGMAWTSLGTAQERIADWSARADSGQPPGTWAIVPHNLGRPAGAVLLDRLPNGDGEVEIGWYLHRDNTGCGYAREAAAGILQQAWRRGHDRVYAIMWPGNEPSAAVCRAIGMHDIGDIPDPWYGTPKEPTSPMFVAERPTYSAGHGT